MRSNLHYSGRMLFRHFRRNHGLTQRQLAIALGITVRYVKKIEAGERFPSAALVQRFKDLSACYEFERGRATVGRWIA